MSLRICSLASGSSGNCYMVRTEDTVLLVDAGLSGRQINLRLGEKGASIEDVSAVLITHEHSDHIQGVSALLKQNKPIFASYGSLLESGYEENENVTCFEPGDPLSFGDITVETFRTSHDAVNPVGYCFKSDGKCICIVTDTGYVSEEIKEYMRSADILVLESNHDVNVLKVGPYPWFLKQRILGDKGHLSNESAGNALADIVASENSEKKRIVLLAHLSKENNFPEMAKATIENILREKHCKPNACILGVLSRNEVSEFYE